MAGAPPLPMGAVPAGAIPTAGGGVPPLPAGAVPAGAPPVLPPGATPVTPLKKSLAAPPVPAVGVTATPILRSKYASEIESAARDHHIDPALFMAIHSVEDRSEDPSAHSIDPATGKPIAWGEMQLTPETFAQYSPSARASITDPAANIEASGRMLEHLMAHYNGDVERVVRAYNQGEGNEDRHRDYTGGYLANVESVYNRLKSEKLGPGNASPLTHGGPRSTPLPVREAGMPGAAGGGVPHMGPIPRAQDPATFLATLEGATEKGEGAVGAAAGDFAKKHPQLVAMMNSPQATTALSGVKFLGALIDNASFVPLDAVMRDVANGNAKNIGLYGQGILSALSHPRSAGDILDAMANKWGVSTRDSLVFWASQPGMRERLAKARPSSPEGAVLQAALGLRADGAKGMVNAPALAGIATFVAEWYNPANRVVELPGIMLRAAKSVAKAATDAATASRPLTRQRIDAAVKTAKNYKDAALAKVPIVGDRFYRMHQFKGDEGEQIQRGYVDAMEKAPGTSRQVLRGENMYGGTSREERQTIHREADKFFNPHETLHRYQPGGGDPQLDSLTGAVHMTKGGVYKGDPSEYVFAAHPDAEGLLTKTIPRGTEGKTLFPMDPDQARRFGALATKGQYARALEMVGVAPQDAAHFEAGVQGKIAGLAAPQDRVILGREITLQRALAEWGRRNGLTAIERPGRSAATRTELLSLQPLTEMKRDETMLGSLSVHDRATTVMRLLHATDEMTKTLAPSSADRLIEGYHPRSGAFAGDQSFEDALRGRKSLDGRGAPGTAPGGIVPGSGKRQYQSIRQAENAGETYNAEFDPALAAETSLTKSMRYQTYVRQALQLAKPIDYSQAVDDTVQGQRLGFTPTTAFPAGARGASGRKQLDEWVDNVAKERFNATTTVQQRNVLPDDKIAAMIDNLKKPIYAAIEKSYRERHPNRTWQTETDLGLPEMTGLSLHDAERDMVIDGHPALQPRLGEKGLDRPPVSDVAWMHGEDQENFAIRGMEGLSNLFRFSLMAFSPLYHPFQNLANMAFVHGRMSPLALAQGLFAPHTIDPALIDTAEHEAPSIFSAMQSTHLIGHKTTGRAAYATPAESVAARDIVGRTFRPNLSQRIATMRQAFRNVTDGSSSPAAAGMHVLQKALYDLDEANRNWVFNVFEDTLAVQQYHTLKAQYLNQGMTAPKAIAKAANRTREIMGDVHNTTDLERALGLKRMTWFYSWIKGQFRLWAKGLSDPRVAGYINATQRGIQGMNNASDSPDPTDLSDRGEVYVHIGDTPYALRARPAFMSRPALLMQTVSTVARQTPLFGKDSWLDALGSEAYNTFDPNIGMMLQAWNTFHRGEQGEEPSWGGKLADTRLTDPQIVQQLGQSVGDRLAPPTLNDIRNTIEQRNPIYLLDQIGITAHSIPAREEAEGLKAKVTGQSPYSIGGQEQRLLRETHSQEDIDDNKAGYGNEVFSTEQRRRELLSR
jgi:Transglycosylase SLT domain